LRSRHLENLWQSLIQPPPQLFLPETSQGNILHRRAQRLRALTNNPAYMAQSEIDQEQVSTLSIVYEALVIPWKINAFDPSVLFTTIYIALLYAIFYSFFEVVVFQNVLIYVAIAYPRYAASLFAMNDLCRSLLAFAAVLWSQSLFGTLGVGGGVSLLGGLMCCCVVGVFALWYFGAKLRARSRFSG
jgi:hypothetical protein